MKDPEQESGVGSPGIHLCCICNGRLGRFSAQGRLNMSLCSGHRAVFFALVGWLVGWLVDLCCLLVQLDEQNVDNF